MKHRISLIWLTNENYGIFNETSGAISKFPVQRPISPESLGTIELSRVTFETPAIPEAQIRIHRHWSYRFFLINSKKFRWIHENSDTCDRRDDSIWIRASFTAAKIIQAGEHCAVRSTNEHLVCDSSYFSWRVKCPSFVPRTQELGNTSYTDIGTTTSGRLVVRAANSGPCHRGQGGYWGTH